MYPPPHQSKPHISHSFVPPSQQYQSHQTSSVSLIAYNTPQSSTQPLTEFPQMDSGLAVLVFNQGDDQISCFNKAMAFLIDVASSRFLSTNNQLRTSSNLRNQATIQDDRVTVQQTEDLDAYDSDCDDVSNAKAVLMANISNYGSDVISEVPHHELHHTNMDNQSVHAMQSFEQTPVVDFIDNEITKSKEKESKYMDKEFDLEKKIEELDNIVYKVELSDEQDFWLQTSNPNTDQSASSPVIIEAPRELPKCLDLDAELLKSQNVYNDLSKSYSQLEKYCISLELTMQLNQEIFQRDSLSNNLNALEIPEYFENNDLKARLQANDTTICKLKEHMKSLRENDKEEKVKHEMDEIETINIELDHRKETVKNAAQIPIVTTIALGMFKLDIEPLSHRLKNNRDAYEDFLKKTIENTNTIYGLIKRARKQNPSEPLLDSAYFSLVSGLQMLKTYDMESLSADELSSKTKSWLWHRWLSHLNFGTLNKLAKYGLARGIPRLKFQKDHLCSTCALGKRKKSSHQHKAEDTNQEKLYLLHMDLCGPMRVESINGKKYILVIVDDYSRFTWVKLLRSKDEAPDAIIKCIKNIQVRLNATVHNVRTNNGT
ncbi:integrase, catalytic region, zinc finger, CCHC-type containing protein [Tanacetum coccineum]|uniref:Integrase, catalytic region, zinc finger, CCHC-type containing protein n=1 Tax=Tanacetum coccineum TaxID=301880 RepID=A0ABQ5C2F2_9ASTR